MTAYGYIRVSSIDQNIDRQIDALKAYGIEEDYIFVDKTSGKNFERPKWAAIIKRIKKGDLLCVTSLDRMGRNYLEVQRQWRWITNEKKADICVLDMPILDTRKHKDLLGTLITDLVLNLLSYVAQHEREMIKSRQAEGIKAAKARGVQFGKPAKTLPENFDAVVRRKFAGELTWAEAAEILKMPVTTLRHRAMPIYKGVIPYTPLNVIRVYGGMHAIPVEKYREHVANVEAEEREAFKRYQQANTFQNKFNWEQAKRRTKNAQRYLRRKEKDQGVAE